MAQFRVHPDDIQKIKNAPEFYPGGYTQPNCEKVIAKVTKPIKGSQPQPDLTSIKFVSWNPQNALDPKSKDHYIWATKQHVQSIFPRTDMASNGLHLDVCKLP